MRVRESQYSASDLEAMTDTTDHGWVAAPPTMDRPEPARALNERVGRDVLGERLRAAARSNVADQNEEIASTPVLARVPRPVLVAAGAGIGLVTVVGGALGAWLLGFWVP
jgi:hypothetical protein